MHRTRRAPGRRTLASIAIGALLAGAAAVGVAAPANAADGKSLTVSSSVVPNEKVVVSVAGSGFTDIPLLPGQQRRSVYIGFVEKGADLSSANQNSAFPNTATYPTEAGAIEGSLEEVVAGLDRSKSYEVIAWPSRATPSDANIYARADVSIDWNALFPLSTPKAELSKSTGLVAGDVVTVTGTGFVEDAPRTNGTREPLIGRFGGVYVSFGYYDGGAWKGLSAKWAVPAAAVAAVGGSARGAIPLAEDGSFSADLVISKPSDAPEGTQYLVRTYAGGGSTYAAFSTVAEATFAPSEPEPQPEPEPTIDPKVVVAPSDDIDPNATNTFTIKGTGFTGPAAVNGAYVGIGATSLFNGTGALPEAGWLAFGWVMPSLIVDGAFETTLDVERGALVPGTAYQVVTSAAHELSRNDRTLDTFTPLTVRNVVVDPVINLSVDTVLQGGQLTATGAGLPAGSTAVVTVNSDPYELGRATVGADGRFTVSGTLPADFGTGSHTVTVAVDGVVLASAPLTVAAAILPAAVETSQAQSCTARAVSGASISWNVKERFRSYVQGSIANGSYSIDWGNGSGAFNTEDDRGRVAYSGSASFSGHSGALDMTLSNPRIQVTSPTSASLILDVRSAGLGADAGVDASGVVFATLRLPAAAESADRISWNGASATLTAAGAEAFGGFYDAGEALDAVSFSFPLGAEVECDTTTSTTLARTGSEQGAETLWIGFGLLLLGAGVFALRRRTARV